MSDAVDHGITVTEIAAMDQPIDVCPESTAAFIGRALRGPLNTPVLIKNFGEFRRRFGDIWARSSLGPAVTQFFEHGGKRLYVVRVANSARGAMLCLPAGGSELVLRAIEPGSTEHIRAAVDFDRLDADDNERFNLTLQRVDPATGHIVDQEFFQRLSWQEDATSFVADELLDSSIARVESPFPERRPDCTLGIGANQASFYVDNSHAGNDGTELSSYDLIGSRQMQRGLFALEQIERFDILYLPSPGKGKDAGPTAIVAADQYCRERGAMLITDPAPQWATALEAATGMRDFGYASPNMIAYFPRIVVRGQQGVARCAGGAIAGLLCKQDRTYGPWQDLDQQGMGFQRQLQPAVRLSENETQLLRRAGINAIVNGPAGRARLTECATLGRGSETNSHFSNLAIRRFCLQVVAAIERATRWAVFEPDDAELATRIRGQVLTYLDCLHDLCAFENNEFVVHCDAGVRQRKDPNERGVTIQLEFQPAGCSKPVSLTLHQTAAGCRVGSAAFALSS